MFPENIVKLYSKVAMGVDEACHCDRPGEVTGEEAVSGVSTIRIEGDVQNSRTLAPRTETMNGDW